MDLKYLTEEILPRRAQEIRHSKNLGTAQPIYVVLSLTEHCCEGHSEMISHTTNNCNKVPKYGNIDMGEEPELRELKGTSEGMKEPEKVTVFWTDQVVAFFLTSEDAHDYKEYQSHNMTEPYVYVFHSGYRNYQMDKLLKGK